jgi:serine/threonine-protein kinase
LVGRGYLQSYDKAESIEMAIRVFEQAVQTDPTYARAWAGLGDAYWKKYEKTREAEWVEKARENCERAVVLDRDLSAARICLGTLADGAGEYEKAAGEFDRALRAEPTNDDAYRGLARAQQHLGKLEEAEKTFRQAIRLRPHYWAGYSWLGKFFADHGRFKEAVEQYQQAAALSPDNGQVYYSLGGVYIYLARYEDAIAALRKSIELRPSYAAYSNLGAIYTRLRRFESAIETLEQALKFPSRDHRIAGNLARAYYWAPGRRDKSAPMYERAIQLGLERLRINPKDADTQVMLANYHAMLGRKKEALDYLRQALKAQPKSHEFLAIAALVHNQLGDRAAAIAFLDKAVAAGYLPAEAGAAIELDSLRDHPKYQAIMRSK